MVRVEMDRGTSGADPNSEPPYLAVTYLVFKSTSSYRSAFTAVEDDIMSDVKNYTDIKPEVQISEIVG